MGAAQRKVWMETVYFPVHTNMYIVLVGPPGRVKKTTALRLGKRMLKQVPNVHFTTNAASAAALVDQLSAIQSQSHQSITSFSSELGTILGSGAADMIDFLTDIWDCEPDWDKQTVTRGKRDIPRPWLNFLAGTTPNWMGENLSKTAVEGGFVARSLFIYESQRILKSPFPDIQLWHKTLEKDLVHDLAQISELNGEFRFDPAARDWYDKWYMDESRFPSIDDPRVVGYFDRKHVHLLKVAMGLSLAESDRMILTVRDLETAKSLLEEIEPTMASAFATVGKNTFATDMERIYEHIKTRGQTGVSYAEILATHYHNVNKKQLDEILVELSDMGKIGRIQGGAIVAI
jgi:hypothetical protein